MQVQSYSLPLHFRVTFKEDNFAGYDDSTLIAMPLGTLLYFLQSFFSGHYAITGFKIDLSRYYQSYILRYYLPMIAMVIVSWISFIIPPDIIPGRTALLVTIFLVLTSIFGHIQVTFTKAMNK